MRIGASAKICSSRDGGIGRRVGLRIQCPKGVQVQVLFPAPQSQPIHGSFLLVPQMQKGDTICRPPFLERMPEFCTLSYFTCLFHMDRFAVWVECTVDANLLAFVLFYQVLAIDVIFRTAGVL